MTDTETDFFAQFEVPAPKPPADRVPTHDAYGRYDNLPSVPGFGVGPWTRVSDLDFFSDDTFLIKWQQRQVVRGLDLNQRQLAAGETADDLFKPMRGSRFNPATSHGKRVINGIVDKCHELIGSNKGSDLGTKFHEFAERLDGGEHPRDFDMSPELRTMLRAYWELRKRERIQPVPGYLERTVFIPELEACGTFDHLDDDNGVIRIGDTKTQSTMHFSMISIPQQLASYAHATLVLNREKWCWEPMPEVDKERAVVLWLPADEPGRAEVLDVDLVKGWKYAMASVDVREWRDDQSTIKTRRAL